MGLFVVMLLATFLYMSIQACNIDNTKLKERMIFKELLPHHDARRLRRLLILTVWPQPIMSIKVTRSRSLGWCFS